MATTLGAAKAQARRLLEEGDYARALRAYDQILTAVPLDYEVRFRVADVLAKVGMAAEAAEVYRAVAMHDIGSGHPLPAIVACQALEALGENADDVRKQLATTYASGSPQLARVAVREAPVDPKTAVPPADLATTEPLDRVVERARKRALDLSAFAGDKQQLHPLPFFSELAHDSFLAVVRSLQIRRLGDGDLVIRQGDPGRALYLVAAGELRVFVTGDKGEKEIARLYENTLFGEMALITDQPRSASVAVVGEADVIEVSREALDRVTATIPAIAEVLDRFTRERLIRNLLQTSPLFAPFTPGQQSDLLRRFEGHEVEAGAEVIKQGQPGIGLFVVLSGALEVTAHKGNDQAPVELAVLRAGDIFGEMSLVSQQPTSATVRARSKSALLFLARTYVERLAAGIPAVAAFFEDVALRRARDNSVRLARLGGPPEPIELDDADVLLL